jgi:hypothetical protein
MHKRHVMFGDLERNENTPKDVERQQDKAEELAQKWLLKMTRTIGSSLDIRIWNILNCLILICTDQL